MNQAQIIAFIFPLILTGLGVVGGFLLCSDWFNKIVGRFSHRVISNLPQTIFSLLFLVAMLPVSLLVLTSTGSRFGSGLVVGIVLGISQKMWLLRQNSQRFATLFFAQLKRPPTLVEIKSLSYIWWGWTILCLVLLTKSFYV